MAERSLRWASGSCVEEYWIYSFRHEVFDELTVADF